MRAQLPPVHYRRYRNRTRTEKGRKHKGESSSLVRNPFSTGGIQRAVSNIVVVVGVTSSLLSLGAETRILVDVVVGIRHNFDAATLQGTPS